MGENLNILLDQAVNFKQTNFVGVKKRIKFNFKFC